MSTVDEIIIGFFLFCCAVGVVYGVAEICGRIKWK
jgi:hypothetical protein